MISGGSEGFETSDEIQEMHLLSDGSVVPVLPDQCLMFEIGV